MEENKIYVVTNINKFKEVCEDKLGSNITADDFIELENFKDERVHLVPRYTSNKYYINPNSPQYDIYVKIQDKWYLKNIISITEQEIENLIDEDVIEDIKTIKHWKNVVGFKVINNYSFYEKIFPTLTDDEAICVIKTLSKYSKINTNYNFYLIFENTKAHIYLHDVSLNVSFKLPYTTVDKETLNYLIKNSITLNIPCKINHCDELIKFNNTTSDIGLREGLSANISFYKKNNRYMIRDIIRNYLSNNLKRIWVTGSSEKEALHKLRNALSEHFLNKELSPTLEMYKHLLDDTNKELNI